MFKFNLGFGGVTAPAELPAPEASYFDQVPQDLPEMKDATVGTLRLAGTLEKRLPPMPSGELQDLSYTNSRQRDAQKLMDEMSVSYAVSNAYKRRGAAKAKARAVQNDRAIKNSGSQGKRSRRKMQGQTKRMQKSTVLRNARDVLGMGTDLYR